MASMHIFATIMRGNKNLSASTEKRFCIDLNGWGGRKKPPPLHRRLHNHRLSPSHTHTHTLSLSLSASISFTVQNEREGEQRTHTIACRHTESVSKENAFNGKKRQQKKNRSNHLTHTQRQRTRHLSPLSTPGKGIARCL